MVETIIKIVKDIEHLKAKEKELMQQLDDLKAQVEQTKNSVAEAVSKINTLVAQVNSMAANVVNPNELQALNDGLKAALAPLDALLAPQA